MTTKDSVRRPRGGVLLGRRTVRVRLTLLYSGLFLGSGAVLLAVTYLLASQPVTSSFKITGVVGQAPATGAAGGGTGTGDGPVGQGYFDAHLVQSATLHQLLVYSLITLAGMAVLTVGLGWLMAGRVLRPLRTMTATTRNISQDNLHERLNLHGPRDEMTDLGDTIDGLLERLEHAFESQRRFVANASHELRTPLATMRTAIDVAQAKPEPAPPQTVALAGRLRGQLDQLDQLLDSLLALARAQHSDNRGGPATLALTDLVTDALRQRAAAITEMRLTVERGDDSEAVVSGSSTLLARLVANLIDNAVRHNHSGGWIRVTTSVEAADGRAQLDIQTGGEHLEQQQVSQLLQPFSRLGAERTGSAGGTGLGLSIVEAIAAAHDGTVELRARPGGGLQVLVEIPLAAAPAAVTPAAVTPAAAAPGAAVPG